MHLHWQEKGQSIENSNVHILDREDRWLRDRGHLYMHLEQPYLNRGEAFNTTNAAQRA